MGNQWLSSAFSRVASSVLGKSNEGKVDNINGDSNPNSKSNSKPDFNFFLLYNIVLIFFRNGVLGLDLFNNKIRGKLPPKTK